MQKINLHLVVLLCMMVGASTNLLGQQVSTLYFLENSPMRHTVNPAFQPVSDGYVNFSPLGWTGLWVGNNSLTVSDAIYNVNGSTVTALHPNAYKQQLLSQLREVTLVDGDISFSLLNFGFRHKENGYVHIGISERIEAGVSLPKTYFTFLLNGGMTDLSGVNSYDLKQTAGRVNAYTEVAGGYSYRINEKWTIGGKLKFLLGQTNMTVINNKLTLDASAEQWHLQANGYIQATAPVRMDMLPEQLNWETLSALNWNQMIQGLTVKDYATPRGYGAGLDLGFTYRPHPQVQITAALNDLGFIVWNGASYTTNIDSTFLGAQNLQYSDYANAGNNYTFDGNKLADDVVKSLQDFAKCLRTDSRTDYYTRMLSAKLNVGIDANFCNNILGIGLVSKTRLFNGRLYEEVMIGGAVRPCNWFNLAVSYALVNNGQYSNIGAGISFMPYDGINLTLAMDYIPTTYAAYNGKYIIPYQDKGVNIAFGFSIVWGTNPKKVKPVPVEELPMAVADTLPAPVVDTVAIVPPVVPDSVLEPVEQPLPVLVEPEMTREERITLTKSMRGIEFELGKSVIKRSSYAALDQVAQIFIANPSYRIEVQGYTDISGSAQRNRVLSQERAEVVMNYLIRAGVSPEQITAVGYGAANPIASNKTEKGRALNRRVAFKITYEQ